MAGNVAGNVENILHTTARAVKGCRGVNLILGTHQSISKSIDSPEFASMFSISSVVGGVPDPGYVAIEFLKIGEVVVGVSS
jgi:hypothetical protein